MADRPIAKAHGKSAAGDEVAGRAHPDVSGANGRAPRGHRILAGRDGGLECVGRRLERVEDGLVARRQRPRRASPSAAARSIAPIVGPSRTSGAPATKPASMQAVPYSGPDAPPTAATRRWPTARRRSPGGVDIGQFGQQLVNGAEADDQVVAVVTVTQHGIEPGQAAAWRETIRPQPASPARTAAASIGMPIPGPAAAAVVDGDGTEGPRAVRQCARV